MTNAVPMPRITVERLSGLWMENGWIIVYPNGDRCITSFGVCDIPEAEQADRVLLQGLIQWIEHKWGMRDGNDT
jgi:hypothetical protein